MPATFTLSFDLELAWGEFYRRPVDVERMAAARAVFPELLRLLERHRVAATFAVVGHLLLEGCDGHPEMPRPSITWRPGDWFTGDPCTDEGRDPAWYAPSLVAMARDSSAGHDIGAHGFSHVPLDDPGVRGEVAAAELEACARLLGGPERGGLSLVYPRNGIGYTEMLRGAGFSSYRAVEQRWYRGRPAAVRKGAHMLDQILACTPRTEHARAGDGVVAVPSSMLFLSREGFRRWVPMASRVARARRGLERAVETGTTFHMWMHAEDLVPDERAMLGGLDAVLSDVARRVEREELVVRTMAGTASELLGESVA